MSRPLRVLHVIGSMDRGGAETWLVHTLRHVNRREVAMDFLAHHDRPGAYDSEITSHGARVFVCTGHRNLLRQIYGLWHLQRLFGPYQVVHSHVDYYGGIVCLLTRLLGVRARIVHSHSDTSVVDNAARLPRRLYIYLMKRLIQWFSTAGLATSESAASLMFGVGWSMDPRWRVLPACIDLSPFHEPAFRKRIRDEFSIPDGGIVLGHVGRFVDEKNHKFLIQVAHRLAARDARAKFILVGSGPTRGEAERQICQLGLKDRFILLEPRDDIPRLMSGVFDFFLFPSLYEGLGLALVEAQAAGLRCFVSTALPPEGIVAHPLVCKIPLAEGPDAWAERISKDFDSPAPLTQEEALALVARTFDIRRNTDQLTEFYHEAVSS